MERPSTNSRLLAATMGISNSPTRSTHPSSVARLSSKPVSRSKIARCRYRTPLLARLTSPLLALADQHEVLRRLYLQLGAFLVADHGRGFPAALADALLGRASQDPLYTRKVGRPFRPPRMRALRFCRGRHRRALALRLDFHLNFSLPGPYFAIRTSRNRSSQDAELQFRVPPLVLIREDRVLKIAELIADRRRSRPGKLPLQLFDQLQPGRSRCRNRRREMRSLIYDELLSSRYGLWITSDLCGRISFGSYFPVPPLVFRLRQIDSTQ
jgi:hypothetical protein